MLGAVQLFVQKFSLFFKTDTFETRPNTTRCVMSVVGFSLTVFLKCACRQLNTLVIVCVCDAADCKILLISCLHLALI